MVHWTVVLGAHSEFVSVSPVPTGWCSGSNRRYRSSLLQSRREEVRLFCEPGGIRKSPPLLIEEGVKEA